MLANSVAVCAAARAKGCKIMHTPITFAADGFHWPAASTDTEKETEGEGQRGRDAEGESSHAANREHRIPSCQ